MRNMSLTWLRQQQNVKVGYFKKFLEGEGEVMAM